MASAVLTTPATGAAFRSRVARGTCALLLTLAAAYLLAFSLGQVVAKTSPDTAHALAPFDGRITGRLVSRSINAQNTPAERARIDKLARAALRADATVTAAIPVLALGAQLHDGAAGARRWFRYAERLSRRDLSTQLWAIEDAVGRGDVAGALVHYDIALRTSPSIAGVLFPVLGAASAGQPVRQALADTLARKPGWGADFINFAAANGADLAATTALFSALHGKREGLVPSSADAALINRLVGQAPADATWSYYASVRPGARRTQIRSPGFTSRFGRQSVLDWTTSTDAGVMASITDGRFSFSAANSSGGVLFQQIELLGPGQYQVVGRGQVEDGGAGASPYWQLSCTDGRVLGRADLNASGKGDHAFSMIATIPPNCPAQALTLASPPSDGLVTEGTVDYVRIS